MKKQYVQKIKIASNNQEVPINYQLPPDFTRLTGILVETENDTMSQKDTIALKCNNTSIIDDYPDSDGVSIRLLRYDQNAQFPFKDSVLPVDIPNAANANITGKWVNRNNSSTGFQPFYAKIYFLGE